MGSWRGISPMQHKLLLLGGRTRVFNRVISTVSKDHTWESLFAFLARVSSIPHMVHKGVEAVVKAELVISDIYWLRVSIHTIAILTVED